MNSTPKTSQKILAGIWLVRDVLHPNPRKLGKTPLSPEHRTGANATSEQSERTKNEASIKNRIIRRSRMPPLPREDIKIVLRIRGGLNISKVGPTMVADAVTTAACIETSKRELDTICPNFQQNIIVVSTPEEENATKYVRIRSILVAGRMHEVAAYRTAPYATCKGIIKDIPRCDGPGVLQRKIVNSRNPLALAAKRIKETSTVIVAFDGYRVPNYVRYENALVRCTLYRKQIDICYVCGRLGHRADVCPSPSEAICRGCGASSPDEEHQCTPKCKLCGERHLTAGKECKQRFQIPYVVRRRRRERARAERSRTRSPSPDQRNRDASNAGQAGPDGRPDKECRPSSKGRRGSRSRSRGRRRSRGPSKRHSQGRSKGRSTSSVRFESRSHSRSRSRSKGRQLHQQSSAAYKGDLSSWADRVRGGPIEVTSGSLPEHDDHFSKIKKLEQENARMKDTIAKLMAEIAEIKNARNAQPPATVTIEAMEVPMAESSDECRPQKKRAIAREQENASGRAKSEIREMLTALSEGLKQLGDKFSALQNNVTAVDEGTNKRLAKMESFLENVVAPALPPVPPVRSTHIDAGSIATLLTPTRSTPQPIHDGSAP